MTFYPKDHRHTVLTGTLARLEPLKQEHVPAFLRFGLDPRIWEWMTHRVTTESGLRDYFELALAERERGAGLPFATVDARTGQVVGTTRFAAIAPADLRAEIGWTWLAPTAWRTGINVDAKRLMLTFAFETLGLRRVELKTDERNVRSRTAMEAMGATFEGVFRKHMVVEDGGVRNSAYYSVLDDEWPAVRQRLDLRLSRGGGST